MKATAIRSRIRGQQSCGFSLVELLVAITIIGVIASMGMAYFGGVRDGASYQRDRRNAQEIAGLAAVASAAGADFAVPEDKEATVQALREGRTPSQGVYKGRLFKLPPMGDIEIQGALKFLAMSGGGLQFRTEGGG